MWVWLNAINKLKSYLHSGSADTCVRSHVIALALSLGVPGKPCQLLTKSKVRFERFRRFSPEETGRRAIRMVVVVVMMIVYLSG